MTGLLDPTDPVAVEQVLAGALPVLGVLGTLEQLAGLPGVAVRSPRAGGAFRRAEPGTVAAGDRVLRLPADGAAELDHVVGGVVLASDPVGPRALPGVLAALVVRGVATSGGEERACVVLTSLRDALGAGPLA